MTPEELHAADFVGLIRQLVDLAANELRADARLAAPVAPEPVVPEPVVEDRDTAVAVLREAFPGRGAASARLAEIAGRSRRTAQQWLHSTPPGRVGDLIAAATRLVYELAVAEAEGEYAEAQQLAADEAERLLAEAEARIAERGDALAAPGLRDYHSADVGGVDVGYAQDGTKDGNSRRINRVSINFNVVADVLPDMETAEEEFQDQVLDDYGPRLSEVLSILEWNSGITIYH